MTRKEPKTAPRLETLARYGRQAEERSGSWNWKDDLAHLTEARRASWRRVLSSVATTESLEETLMDPLRAAKAGNEAAADYLEVHAQDERRHFLLLTRYLKNTFKYQKKKRTAMDRVLYDRLFPGVSKVFARKPAYGFALLYAYEKFSVSVYDGLLKQAQEDGAQNLLTLFKSIEKDELRHIAGMEALLREEIATAGLNLFDLTAIRGILNLMFLDVDMRAWAVHNREVRAHLQELGFDTDKLTAAARKTIDETLALISEARVAYA